MELDKKDNEANSVIHIIETKSTLKNPQVSKSSGWTREGFICFWIQVHLEHSHFQHSKVYPRKC